MHESLPPQSSPNPQPNSGGWPAANPLQSRLTAVRRAMNHFRLFRTLLMLGLATWVGFLLMATIDYVWILPMPVRVLAWIALGAATAILIVRHARAARKLDQLQAAVEMERAYPHFGQRIRTAQQYLQDPAHAMPAAPHLVGSLVRDAAEQTRGTHISEIVPWSRLVSWSGAVAATTLVGLLLLVWVPQAAVTCARLFLLPWHYTQVVVSPQTDPVPIGTDVTIQAEVTGRPLESLELWTRSGDNEAWNRLPMRARNSVQNDDRSTAETRALVNEADKTEPLIQGVVSALIEQPTTDLEYKVVGGPVQLPTYSLKVLQPLTQKQITARIRPPEYTELPPEESSEPSITVVEGSSVAWELLLNRPCETAHIETLDGDANSNERASNLPLQIEGSTLRCELPELADPVRFQIVATAADGMQFRSDPIQVRVRKDQAPTLRFQRPPEQIEVTPTTEVALGLQVEDDFGLSKVGIEYDLGDGTKHVLWQDQVEAPQKLVAAAPLLLLEEHELDSDDAITYYAFAEDNRPQPRRVRSELQFIDIRPYKREYEIVNGQCQGGGGGCLSLEELITRQRNTFKLTFANQDQQPAARKLVDRIVRSQQEILTATDEFTSGWESKFGPEPSLHFAMQAMQSAIDELEAGQLVEGGEQQAAALSALVSARKNLRQFIKNCQGGSMASACQKFDNQMVQKLRRPPAAEKSPASSSQQQQQLAQLARQQREWSEQVSPPSGGAQFDPPSSPSKSQPQKPAARGKPSATGKPSSGASSSASQAASSSPNSASDLIESQRQSAAQAEQLQQAVEDDLRASELARERMDQIAEQIKQSVEELRQGEVARAAREAEQAATRLEQLREHLAGLQGAELSERLGLAQQLAQRLAVGEAAVAQQLGQGAAAKTGASQTASNETSGSGSSDGDGPSAPTRQEQLAQSQAQLGEGAATLSDVLDRLTLDAMEESSSLRSGLQSLHDNESPGEVAAQMSVLAEQIRRGPTAQTRALADESARAMNAIAAQLQQLQRDLLQPKLDELMAAEAQAAGLLAALHSPTGQAKVAAQLPELRQQVDALGVRPGPTSAVGGGRSNGTPTQPGSGGAASDAIVDPPGTPQLGAVNLSAANELRQIVGALQEEIQAVMLLSARMDADEPVPPQYRPLVEEYYKTISDDLQ